MKTRGQCRYVGIIVDKSNATQDSSAIVTAFPKDSYIINRPQKTVNTKRRKKWKYRLLFIIEAIKQTF